MSCNNNKIISVCFIIGLWFSNDISAVQITSLDVPQSAWDAITLNCRYDLLEDEKLYAVKWYKDNNEFFRCLGDGSIQEFPLNDIKIYYTSPAQTGSCYFELTALTDKSGGEYMCEVSLDWPTFKTVTQSSRLKIIQPSKIVQTQLKENASEEPPSRGSTYLKSNFLLSAIFICIVKIYYKVVFDF